MRLTGGMIRKALGLLGWSMAELSSRARLPLVAIEVALAHEHATFLHGGVSSAVKQVLEQAGVEFTSDEAGVGVKLRKGDPKPV